MCNSWRGQHCDLIFSAEVYDQSTSSRNKVRSKRQSCSSKSSTASAAKPSDSTSPTPTEESQKPLCGEYQLSDKHSTNNLPLQNIDTRGRFVHMASWIFKLLYCMTLSQLMKQRLLKLYRRDENLMWMQNLTVRALISQLLFFQSDTTKCHFNIPVVACNSSKKKSFHFDIRNIKIITVDAIIVIKLFQYYLISSNSTTTDTLHIPQFPTAVLSCVAYNCLRPPQL